jgi:predicted Zn-dependent protease
MAYERDGAWDRALAAHETILKANPGNVAAALSTIRIHRRNNETARAFELAKAARRHAPDDPHVAHVLGRLAFDSGDQRWAVSLLEESARRQNANPELLCDLGEALYSTGRVRAAEEAIRNALAADSGFSRATMARQFLELVALSEDPAKAASSSAEIERALKANPASVPALMAKGALSEQRSDPAGAMQCYEEALQHHPDFAPAQKRLAVLYTSNRKDNQKAYELATKARQSFPDDAEVAKAFGVALLRQGNFSRASSLLQESARRRTDDGELMYYLARAQLELKRSADSRQTFERALKLGLAKDLAEDARRTLASLENP